MPCDVGAPAPALFPELEENDVATARTGVLPSQDIRGLIAAKKVAASQDISEDQIQPASLDLRLGEMAHRVQASFLPGPSRTVAEALNQLRMARIDLTKTSVLEKGCVYIIPLLEELNLPAALSVKANPKSSTGRLDIFTRLITDYGVEFERVPAGYKGKLYAEIVPRTFPVILRAGMKLNQIRFLRGNPSFGDPSINALDEEKALVYHGEEDIPIKAMVDNGLRISVSMRATDASEIVAFKAKKSAPAIDLANVNYYPAEDFWDAIRQPSGNRLVLEPGDFYILASREKVRVPADFAAEMVPFDPSMGEFRVHYAGFFDPGFGYGSNDIKGTRAVLEVRADGVPFVLEDGQIIGRLTYMRLLTRPDKIYGVNIGSNYQQQGLALSKHFKKK